MVNVFVMKNTFETNLPSHPRRRPYSWATQSGVGGSFERGFMSKSEAYEKWLAAINAVPDENTAIKAFEEPSMYVLETYAHDVERQEFKYQELEQSKCHRCGRELDIKCVMGVGAVSYCPKCDAFQQ